MLQKWGHATEGKKKNSAVASNKEETMVNMLIAQTDALVTGSADGTAKIWSLYSGECLFVSGFSSWFSGLKIVHTICFFTIMEGYFI